MSTSIIETDLSSVNLQGIPGPIGPQGPRGFIGERGPRGFDGIQGPKGDQGFMGPAGPQGNTGGQGLPGPQGTPGTVGSPGAQGAQGAASTVPGPQGTAGATGPQGAEGAASTVPGPQGTAGATGPQGAEGAQGAQGNDGTIPDHPWEFVSTNSQATKNSKIIADTSGGQITIDLPASPEVGDYVLFVDGDDWEINSLIVGRNGQTIEGIADDVELDIFGYRFDFIFNGSTWKIYYYTTV